MSDQCVHKGETRTMKSLLSKRVMWATAAALLLTATNVSAAEKKYDTGATDTEIKLGQTVPHSGPGSLYGVLGRVGEGYFQLLNVKGDIHGRKGKFFTKDAAHRAPKATSAPRRLF